MVNKAPIQSFHKTPQLSPLSKEQRLEGSSTGLSKIVSQFPRNPLAFLRANSLSTVNSRRIGLNMVTAVVGTCQAIPRRFFFAFTESMSASNTSHRVSSFTTGVALAGEGAERYRSSASSARAFDKIIRDCSHAQCFPWFLRIQRPCYPSRFAAAPVGHWVPQCPRSRRHPTQSFEPHRSNSPFIALSRQPLGHTAFFQSYPRCRRTGATGSDPAKPLFRYQLSAILLQHDHHDQRQQSSQLIVGIQFRELLDLEMPLQ